MIEKMKSNPGDWEARNQAALKRVVDRPSLRIWQALVSLRAELVTRIVDQIQSAGQRFKFGHYQKLGNREIEWYVGIVYRFLLAAVRTGERTLLLQYA